MRKAEIDDGDKERYGSKVNVIGQRRAWERKG